MLAYEMAIRAGKFVVIVHGTSDQAKQARDLLAKADAELATEHAA